MIDRDLLNNVRPWIESTLGYELPEAGDFGLRIGVTPDNDDAMPLYAVRVDNTVAVAARSEWLVELRPILVDLHPDLLFSVAGTYELSRVTLHDGVAVWGRFPATSPTQRPGDRFLRARPRGSMNHRLLKPIGTCSGTLLVLPVLRSSVCMRVAN